MIKEALEKFGLSAKEVAVYLATLELGDATAQNIARKADEKRPTTYVMLESLQHRGLVTEHLKGKSKHYFAAAPRTLLSLLRDQKRDLERKEGELAAILPELDTLHNISAYKPKVQLFEGVNGLKAIYEETLRAKEEILAFTGVTEQVTRELADWLNQDYAPRRAKRRISAKVIAPDTDAARAYQQRDASNLRETRIVSATKFPFTVEINIYGKKVAFISFKEKELIGVVIESAEIARTMRSIFFLAWGMARQK
jgi:sugar-specific transcriptional regulator TrmB